MLSIDLVQEEIKEQRTSSLIDSLSEGLDKSTLLRAFALTNSGGGKQPYLAMPDTVGFHYLYFILPFQEGLGQQQLDGVFITTYKFGRQVGRYNENEVFAEVKARLKDKRLGRLNLVGESIERFQGHPEEVHTQDGLSVFQSGERTLVLAHADGRITWFKYALVKDAVSGLEPLALKALLEYH